MHVQTMTVPTVSVPLVPVQTVATVLVQVRNHNDDDQMNNNDYDMCTYLRMYLVFKSFSMLLCLLMLAVANTLSTTTSTMFFSSRTMSQIVGMYVSTYVHT